MSTSKQLSAFGRTWHLIFPVALICACSNENPAARADDPIPEISDNSAAPPPVLSDADLDGMDDGWERDHGLDPTKDDAALDLDGDGLTNLVEFLGRTLPEDVDTDDDGLADGAEDLNKNGVLDPGETSAAVADTDQDGVSDGVELGRTSPVVSPKSGIRGTDTSVFVPDADPTTTTDPTAADTDGDGIPDGSEDLNHNGRVDQDEASPLDLDSDDDGIPDGVEDANHNGLLDPNETSPARADTDTDGIPDGIELGVTTPVADPDGAGPLAGTDLSIWRPDADPSTTTNPSSVDSDGDGVLDGDEDWNHDGAFRPDGELNPLVGDSDGDGIPDAGEGIAVACAEHALRPVVRHQLASADLSVALPTSYTQVSVLRDASGVGAGLIFTDPTTGITGIVMSRTPGAQTALGEKQAVRALISPVLNLSNDQDRASRTWDGFNSVVTTALAAPPTMATSDLAARVAEVVAQRGVLSGAPLGVGRASNDFTVSFSTILRSPSRSIFAAAFVPNPASDPTLIALADVSNGTHVAQFHDLLGRGCDDFVAVGTDMLDLLWVVDNSCSMSADQAAVAGIAQDLVNLLASTNLSWRLALTSTDQLDGSISARGLPGFTPSAPRTAAESASWAWAQAVGALGVDGSGYERAAAVGLAAAQRALPGATQEDPARFRSGAAVVVIHMSDEEDYSVKEASGGHDASCTENYTKELRIEELVRAYEQLAQDSSIASFATFAITGIQPHPTGNACDFNSGSGDCPGRAQHGRSFIEIANATGGGSGSICGNTGQIVQDIVRAGAGIASQFELTQAPISSTLRVVVASESGSFVGQPELPRSRINGFDYAFELDTAANIVRHKLVFFGTGRPAGGRELMVSYRTFVERSPDSTGVPCDCPQGQLCQVDDNECVVDPTCGTPCPGETGCNPATGLCEEPCRVSCAEGETCDLDLGTCLPTGPCAGGCEPGQHCDVGLGACVPDGGCNPACGPGQHCDFDLGTCVSDDPCNGSCASGQHCDLDLGVCVTDDPCEGRCVAGAEICDTSSGTPVCKPEL